MNTLTCSRLHFRDGRDGRDNTIKTSRGRKSRQFGPTQALNTLCVLVLAATLELLCWVTTQAQEPGRTAPAPAGGGGAGVVEARAPQGLSQQVGGGGGGGVGWGQTGVYTDRLQSMVARAAPGRNPSKALVVLSSGPDEKVQMNLQEDLAVMSHILDKAMEDSLGPDQRQPKAMGVDLFFWPNAGSLRQAYLEGYGALFLLRVNFPLRPPPAKGDAKKEDPKGSSAWEEAREEVFGEPGMAGMSPAAAEDPYVEERVNRLKKSLLEAIKNAANIRDLKTDEGVTVCVLGTTKMQPGRVKAIGRSSGAKPPPVEFSWRGGAVEGAPQHGTILSLRVKKSDIDAFAKGKMDLDEFRQKALSTIYEGDSGSGPGFGGFGAGGFSGAYGSGSQ